MVIPHTPSRDFQLTGQECNVQINIEVGKQHCLWTFHV